MSVQGKKQMHIHARINVNLENTMIQYVFCGIFRILNMVYFNTSESSFLLNDRYTYAVGLQLTTILIVD